MTFEEVLDQALAMLHRRQRVTYQTLKLQFGLDNERLEALKDALLFSCAGISDEDDRGLVWTGDIPDPTQNPQPATDRETRFQAILPAVIGLLQAKRRITYRTFKYVFGFDDALLEEVKEELLFTGVAHDEDAKGLVWKGATQPPVSSETGAVTSPVMPIPSASPPVPGTDTQVNGLPPGLEGSMTLPLADEPMALAEPARSTPEAERRQLTVMFCDLVGSTDLSGKLDPEDLREVVRSYQETSSSVIARYDGHIAQYLGDGLLIYFGFPVAHEDDAQRAVHTGLGVVEAMDTLNTRLADHYGVELAVRIGIHTGPVVVGEMGGGDRQESLALGETPNIAARLEGLASPNTVVISPMTARLVQRAFVLEELGAQTLKGLSEPMVIVRVMGAVEPESTGPAMKGFGELVGRDEEVGLLLRRWAQSKEGQGQVILLSGEAGIGKSSLVNGLQDRARQEGLTRVTLRCSPYHTSSSFYPIIDSMQRTLGWQPDDPEDTKLTKLERALEAANLALVETVPLMASLLSLKLPEGRYPDLTLSPQQLRQQTQDTLVAWLQETAERQPVLAVWEDLHWADPSTLELLGLFIDQAPTVSMLHLMTCRPEFEPPWPTRSHMTPITLNRLERSQVEALITHMADNKTLPVEVVAHIVAKTDGVPLYIEELTKMLLQSNLLQEETEQYVLTGPLTTVAIPDTLQDSLMARLDQMKTAKEVAQFGAVLGREFTYEMLVAISSQNRDILQEGLAQLVAAELLYQRGRPPCARYIFKHALIQDAAYASLLRSTRQQVHGQIAQVLEARFSELVETQPELLAHHFTKAGQDERAIEYWQQAGQRARERAANIEAQRYFTRGLECIATLPETPERVQLELDMHIALGAVLAATKGQASTEAEQAYLHAQVLGRQVNDPSVLYRVLQGLYGVYFMRGDMRTSLDLVRQLCTLAEQAQGADRLVEAHRQLGQTLYFMGELAAARTHHEQAATLYDPQRQRFHAFRFIHDPGVNNRTWLAQVLWMLGYPDQARQQNAAALEMVSETLDPFTHMTALTSSLFLLQFLRQAPMVQQQAEEVISRCIELGAQVYLGIATAYRGWALSVQGQTEEGLVQIRQGMSTLQQTGTGLLRPCHLNLLTEACGAAGQPEAGLQVLNDTDAEMEHTGIRFWEAEQYRLRGELLQHVDCGLSATELTPEACFHKALDVARRQQAKSFELRAATSLARLWQSQGKRQEAYDLLASVYKWFTEGFDTVDLLEAKALLTELGGS